MKYKVILVLASLLFVSACGKRMSSSADIVPTMVASVPSVYSIH